MNRFAETLIKMIDDGNDIFDVAKYFGGIEGMLKLSEKYPYLQSIIKTKLGGVLYCGVPNEDEIMIPFELPFIMTELESIGDDSNHYVGAVDIIIPELTEKKDIQILMTWLEDYLSHMGLEVGSFNDGKLNMKAIWIRVGQINGMTIEVLRDKISDSEVLKIIPKEYLGDW
jgi:hypothetical protein